MTRVRTGLDRVCAGEIDIGRVRRWALLTNRRARTADGTPSGDALRAEGYTLALFLSPEHGLEGTAGAGVEVGHSAFGDVPALSLYGASRAPVVTALREVDGIIIDLPDVGCRYYTYPATVQEALRLAGSPGLPVVLLDRPNPLGGSAIEGNLPDAEIVSDVCASRVPVRHGLTLGELTRWNISDRGIDVDLTVVPCAAWSRTMLWPRTDLPWVPPSPALHSFAAALLYPGTCLIEGTTMSEGRGTDTPFEIVGAPGLDAEAMARALSESSLAAGVRFEPVTFTPVTGTWEGEECRGVRIIVDNLATFHPVATGLALVHALMPASSFAFRERFFDLLAGTSRVREQLQAGADPAEIVAGWAEDERAFKEARRSVLIYNGDEQRMSYTSTNRPL